MLALLEGAVSDLAQEAGVVVQGANVAPVDRVGMGVEMVIAQGLQPIQHRVDLEPGGHDGVESFGVVGGAAGGHGLASGGGLHRFRVITIALAGWLVKVITSNIIAF